MLHQLLLLLDCLFALCYLAFAAGTSYGWCFGPLEQFVLRFWKQFPEPIAIFLSLLTWYLPAHVTSYFRLPYLRLAALVAFTAFSLPVAMYLVYMARPTYRLVCKLDFESRDSLHESWTKRRSAYYAKSDRAKARTGPIISLIHHVAEYIAAIILIPLTAYLDYRSRPSSSHMAVHLRQLFPRTLPPSIYDPPALPNWNPAYDGIYYLVPSPPSYDAQGFLIQPSPNQGQQTYEFHAHYPWGIQKEVVTNRSGRFWEEMTADEFAEAVREENEGARRRVMGREEARRMGRIYKDDVDRDSSGKKRKNLPREDGWITLVPQTSGRHHVHFEPTPLSTPTYPRVAYPDAPALGDPIRAPSSATALGPIELSLLDTLICDQRYQGDGRAPLSYEGSPMLYVPPLGHWPEMSAGERGVYSVIETKLKCMPRGAVWEDEAGGRWIWKGIWGQGE